MLDAAALMEFVPEGAIEVLTGEHRLLRHPDWMFGPSLAKIAVLCGRPLLASRGHGS